MPQRGPDEAEVVIPISEEKLVVGKVARERGGVRVRTTVREDQQEIDIPLTRAVVDVRRVAADRWVDAHVADRLEGDTLIVSLHREVPVVVNRLQVYEELHIEMRAVQQRHRESVAVRREEAVIEELASAGLADRATDV